MPLRALGPGRTLWMSLDSAIGTRPGFPPSNDRFASQSLAIAGTKSVSIALWNAFHMPSPRNAPRRRGEALVRLASARGEECRRSRGSTASLPLQAGGSLEGEASTSASQAIGNQGVAVSRGRRKRNRINGSCRGSSSAIGFGSGSSHGSPAWFEFFLILPYVVDTLRLDQYIVYFT